MKNFFQSQGHIVKTRQNNSGYLLKTHIDNAKGGCSWKVRLTSFKLDFLPNALRLYCFSLLLSTVCCDLSIAVNPGKALKPTEIQHSTFFVYKNTLCILQWPWSGTVDLKDVSRREEEGEGVWEERVGSLVSERPRTFFVIRGGLLCPLSPITFAEHVMRGVRVITSVC